MRDRQLEAGTLHNLGWAYLWGGDKQKALEYHTQARELYRQMGDIAGEANALRGMGRAYGELGQAQKGIDLSRQAVALAQASREPAWESAAFYSLAILYRFAGRLAEARESVETALRLRESARADVFDRDLRSFYRATTYQYYEFYIDLLMRMRLQDKSKRYDVEAFHLSERSRARGLLELLAEARVSQNPPAELVKREQSLQRQINATSEALRTLKSKPYTVEQVADLDRQLVALLLDLRQVSDQISAAKSSQVALAEAQPFSLDEIRRQVLDADTLLLEYSLGAERSYLWAVTSDSINDFELPKRAVIEAQAKKVYDLMTARAWLKEGAQWPARVSEADKQLPIEAAKLSRMLLGPVAAQLGSKRLLIVADGALQYIPFAALPEPLAGEGRQTKAPTTMRPPLIVNHEIVNLPSASTLAVLRRELAGRASAPKMAAILADPVFSEKDERFSPTAAQASGKQPATSPSTRSIAQSEALRSAVESGVMGEGGELRRLKASRKEAEALAARAPKDQFFQALDFNASRATAMSEELSQYRIVHFTAHGSINSRHPDLSGLIFSLVNEKGEAQDGFLRVREIYNLKLPADLVTLSACQTALGKDVRGEGLVGMTRGFMYAGAARVLASLWAVRDEETASLMTAFYTHLLGKDGRMRMTPAAALRQAQIEMWRRERRSEPFYWAGFVLQGEYK
jgi:CHAT domain-containing protein